MRSARTTLALATARGATVEAGHLAVKGLAGLDVLGLRQRRGAAGLGDAAVVAEAGHGGGEGGEESDDLSGMHCEKCCWNEWNRSTGVGLEKSEWETVKVEV